jgi:glycosyltransferase involved in cell wall biosynthesis
MVNDTVNLADKLGLTGKNVFFNFGWVPYHERHNYFLESDAGIITHPQHIETRFSFRTRILDYIWTGLPIISTKGDTLSGLVEKEEMGITVAEDDPAALAQAILKTATDRSFYAKCAANVERIKPMFYWEEVAKPLIDYCKDPVRSAMKKDPGSAIYEEGRNAPSHTSAKNATAKFFYHLKNSGPKKTMRYVSNYLKHQ